MKFNLKLGCERLDGGYTCARDTRCVSWQHAMQLETLSTAYGNAWLRYLKFKDFQVLSNSDYTPDTNAVYITNTSSA